jgi:hypothetical protein
MTKPYGTRAASIKQRLEAAGISPIVNVAGDVATITGTNANGDGFTVQILGVLNGNVTIAPRGGKLLTFAADRFEAGLNRIVAMFGVGGHDPHPAELAAAAQLKDINAAWDEASDEDRRLFILWLKVNNQLPPGLAGGN